MRSATSILFLTATTRRTAIGAFVASTGADHHRAAIAAWRGVALHLHQLFHQVARVFAFGGAFGGVVAVCGVAIGAVSIGAAVGTGVGFRLKQAARVRGDDFRRQAFFASPPLSSSLASKSDGSWAGALSSPLGWNLRSNQRKM